MINQESLWIGASLRMPFSDAVGRVKDALARENFEILTEIDLQNVLKEKSGKDIGRYLMLGAWHPETAHRAIRANREAGLLFPSQLGLFEAEPGRVTVSAMNPIAALSGSSRGDFQAPATEIADRLQRVIASLPS